MVKAAVIALPPCLFHFCLLFIEIILFYVFRSIEITMATMETADTNMNSVSPTPSQEDAGGESEDRDKYFEPKSVLSQNPRSSYWAFFKFKGTEKTGPAEPKTLHCILCLDSEHKKLRKKDIVYTGGTTNLKSHMELHHKDKLQEMEDKKEKSSASQQPILNFAVNRPTSSVKKWPKNSARQVEVRQF